MPRPTIQELRSQLSKAVKQEADAVQVVEKAQKDILRLSKHLQIAEAYEASTLELEKGQ